MADALVYADEYLHCDKILELSTLTGACMVSLGTALAGLWTTTTTTHADDDDMAQDLLQAGQACGQRLWHMPLEESYRDALQSKVADLKNLGSRYGGAIHAALFLSEFVNKNVPYAHVDMAGTVWNMAQNTPTGWGALLVTEWVRRQAADYDGEA